jgi:death-on-curing protein
MTATPTDFEPEWVMLSVALAYHERQIAEHGGGVGVRDMGLLESAMARPLNAFHYKQVISFAELAAAYAYGITKNHPFVDGNKRTAFVVARAFLVLNGYDINATREEKYLTFLSLAEGTLSEEELAAWIKLKLVEKP